MGYANVDVMLDETESWQLTEWLEYLKYEEEADLRGGLQASADAAVAHMKRAR